MKHYGGWSFIELYNLPVALRNWFAEQLTEEYKKQAEEYKKSR